LGERKKNVKKTELEVKTIQKTEIDVEMNLWVFNLENSMGGNWSSAPNPLMICLSRIHIISGRKKLYTKDMLAIINMTIMFFSLSMKYCRFTSGQRK
jgi:hypothetical protein